MTPSPWIGLVLALAAFRLTRFVGWDDFPPVLRARAWLIGESFDAPALDDLHHRSWVIIHDLATRHGDRLYDPSRRAVQDLDDEYGDRSRGSYPSYLRPTLAKFVHCSWCVGFWISAAVYAAWLEWPRATLYGLSPFAISAVVGLVAKNLDP